MVSVFCLPVEWHCSFIFVDVMDHGGVMSVFVSVFVSDLWPSG